MATLAVLTLAIVLYGSFWVGLALLVNSFRRDSAFNAVALAMAWTLLLLVAPAAMNATAQVLYPAPARAEMVLAVRNAAIDAEARPRRHRGTLSRGASQQQRPCSRPDGGGATRQQRRQQQRTLAVTLAADARADAVLAEQEARVREQRRLSDRLAFLVPPALVNDAIVELAGSGHTRWTTTSPGSGNFRRGGAISSSNGPSEVRPSPAPTTRASPGSSPRTTGRAGSVSACGGSGWH